MGKLRVLILFPLLVSSALVTANAQNATTLQVGTPVERSLAGGQAHEFTVNMEANSYIQLVVEQRGIDVFIKVSSPERKNLGEYDTPNGADGPEHVSFVAGTAGTYHITVSPLDPNNSTPGRYEIKVVDLREATEQELKAHKNLEAAKAKGIALLTEMETTIQEIKSPYNRIQAQLKVAELLWEVDEKRAAKSMSDAVAGIKEFLTTSDTITDKYLQQFQEIMQLREEVVRVLAERDPDAALSFLHSTTPRQSPYGGSPSQFAMLDAGLELSIANQLVQKDPNRAAQIARRTLKSGYSSNLLLTVPQLAQKSPELAAELVHDIATKLLSEEKLIKNSDAANFAITLIRSHHTSPDAIQFVTKNMGSPFRSGLLSEDDYKQLLQKAVGEVVSYTLQRTAGHSPDAIWSLLSGLQMLGPELDKAISGSKAAIEKKSAELVGPHNMHFNVVQELQNAIGSNPVEAVLENIEKAPTDYREQLYIQLAHREANNGDLARAKQIINDYVTNPYQRRQALTNIEQQEMNRALGKGKVEEALRTVSSVKNPSDRAVQLSQIINQIGQGQKRATALSLLEQARGLLSSSPQAQDAEQMHALFELARAFSNFDSKRAFEIVDPLIDQINDICVAARTLEGFGGEFFEDDELILQNGNSVATIVSQMSSVLGTLSLTNFDRAKAASEKIRLPEVRLKVYLEIAQQTIEGGP